MTTNPTLAVPSTEFLPNVGAIVADRGPYDGKRGTVWTPNGQAFFSDAHREWDQPGVGRDFTVVFPGTLTRNGVEQGYTESLRVRFSRWYHTDDKPGCYWTAYPVAGMPETAGKLITEQVNESVALTVAVIYGRDGQRQADVGVFDAIWREAARADAQRDAAQFRTKAAEYLARADALDAQLADPDYTPAHYGKR